MATKNTLGVVTQRVSTASAQTIADAMVGEFVCGATGKGAAACATTLWPSVETLA
jgi:hypothetical protein